MSRYFEDFAYQYVLDGRSVLCRRIRDEIDKNLEGETFTAIAADTHVSYTTISKAYHLKHTKVSLVMLIILCKRLGISSTL